jgi:hypothetical protein
LWGGKRSDKFQAAKNSVLGTLKETLGEDNAKQIMEPFLKSRHALTKSDLGKIIAAADHALQAKSQVGRLVESGSGLPSLSDLAGNREQGWTDAFANFCAGKGSTAFRDAVQVADLQDAVHKSESGQDQSQSSFNSARSQAAELLKRNDLPKDLRNELTRFVASNNPPSNTGKLRNLLAQYRAGQTGTTTEVGKLYREFQSVVNEKKEKIEAQRQKVVHQQQQQRMVQQIKQQRAEMNPSSNENSTSSDHIVNMNDVNLDDLEEPPDDDEIEIEKSVSYDPDFDPIALHPGSEEVEVEYEVDLD